MPYRTMVKFLNARLTELRLNYVEAIAAMTRDAGGIIKLGDIQAGVTRMPLVAVAGLPSGFQFRAGEFRIDTQAADGALILRGVIVSDDAETEPFDADFAAIPMSELLNIAEIAVESLERLKAAA